MVALIIYQMFTVQLSSFTSL